MTAAIRSVPDASAPVGTKTSPPRLPTPWLRRDRLNDRLSDLAPGCIFLVAAPAGSGKSTLLADWFAHDCTASATWLTLDARDNEAGRLGKLLARVLGHAEVARHGLHEADTVVVDRVFEAMSRRRKHTVLVLDDVHELTARTALQTLEHLALRLPATLSLVLATRADPPIGLPRLRVEGRLEQLRMHDLACTPFETTQLLKAHGVDLDEDATRALWSRTEGWIAGIRLAALALVHESDPHRFVEDAVRTETVVSDYLLHEVLQRQRDDVQQFLLRASVAEPLTPDLAVDLSGCEDAEARLAELEQKGVFLTGLADDPPVYRFHSLFGALLRAELRHEDPGLTDELQRRAARWYAAHDMPLEAEAHARAAGDWELAGDLACSGWVASTLSNGEVVRPPVVDVDAEVAEHVAPLAELLAADAALAGDRARANRWRARADALGGSPLARALVDVLFGRAFGADVRSLRGVRTVRELVGRSRPAADALVRVWEAELLLDDGEIDSAVGALFDARWVARRDSPRVIDECDALLALVCAADGRVRAATRFLDGREPESRTTKETNAAFVRRLARVLCDAQRGRTVSARATLEEISPNASTPHLARIVYDELVDHLLMAGSRRLGQLRSDAPFAWRVRVALGSYDDARAGRLAGPAEGLVAGARRALAAGRYEHVVAMLQPIVGHPTMARTHPRTRVEAAAMLAIAADALDDATTAADALRTACAVAGPGDLRAPLVAHGAMLAPVLDRYAWQLAAEYGYAVELIDVLQPTEAPVFVEPLTERERAVLEYLPTMMSNSEIARQLRVSVNTVKTHLKSVYRKLGVDRRRDAVLRGRQLEII